MVSLPAHTVLHTAFTRCALPLSHFAFALCCVVCCCDRYFWRKQWLAQREQQTQPLSEDGWLHIDERGQVVREGASHQSVQPYQPSMLAYMAPSPTPAALTISYQPHVDINSERHFVRF